MPAKPNASASQTTVQAAASRSADLACLSMEDEQVDQQHRQHAQGECDPDPESDVHKSSFDRVVRRSLQAGEGRRSGPKPG